MRVLNGKALRFADMRMASNIGTRNIPSPDCAADHEARIQLYIDRINNKQDIWTGNPLPESEDIGK